MAGSPIQPSASEASVIPSWQADRYELRFLRSPSRRFALRLPAAAIVSIREERKADERKFRGDKETVRTDQHQDREKF